jgi:hypothetical protein
MAFTNLTLTNSVSVKSAPVGFSWTTFIFGCFPALFRGDWQWFFIQLICQVMTGGLSALIFMFIYNKIYIKKLIAQGYKLDEAPENLDAVEANLGLKVPVRD